MYRMPKKERLNSLLSKELIQVCIGCNEVIFHFEDNCSIMVSSCIRHITKENEFLYEKLWIGEIHLNTLLGSKILETAILDDKSLAVHFSNGSSIVLFDDDDNYEAIKFDIDGDIIIV